MRLVRFDRGEGPKPGILDGGEVLDVSSDLPDPAAILPTPIATLEALRRTTNRSARHPVDDVRLLAPIEPASLRDFLSFEDHAKAGAARRGVELDPAWYEIPIYYKGNHRSILGPDEPVHWPSFTEKLDFELELACVIGARARDLSEAEAETVILGYTIMNDWSARDVQRAEMAMRLGPAKSKDFATSLGPCIVTADEIDPRDGLRMVARVNGETWCEASTKGMHWTFPQMISYVSRGEDVYPGDVYGSGTPFGGCGLDQDKWIAPGDTVELEIEGIGVLRSLVSRPR